MHARTGCSIEFIDSSAILLCKHACKSTSWHTKICEQLAAVEVSQHALIGPRIWVKRSRKNVCSVQATHCLLRCTVHASRILVLLSVDVSTCMSGSTAHEKHVQSTSNRNGLQHPEQRRQKEAARRIDDACSYAVRTTSIALHHLHIMPGLRKISRLEKGHIPLPVGLKIADTSALQRTAHKIAGGTSTQHRRMHVSNVIKCSYMQPFNGTCAQCIARQRPCSLLRHHSIRHDQPHGHAL